MSELEPLFPSTPANAITVVTVTQKSDQNKEEEAAAATTTTTAEMDHEQQLKKVWSCDFFFLSNCFSLFRVLF